MTGLSDANHGVASVLGVPPTILTEVGGATALDVVGSAEAGRTESIPRLKTSTGALAIAIVRRILTVIRSG
jgi:hypothetical protein